MPFLNYYLLFGFIRPVATPTTETWLIGNEMVFYWLVEQPMIEKGSTLAAAASSRLAARDELR